MAVVHIPTQMRQLTDGRDRVQVPGRTLRQVFEALEEAWPGTRARIIADGKLRPELAVAVDGAVVESGLVHDVADDAEVHLLPAIGGGAAPP